MMRIAHVSLQVILDTLLGQDCPTAQSLSEFGMVLAEQKIELESTPPQDWRFKPQISVLMNRWLQIFLLDWIYRKWNQGGRETFPKLEAIWRIMEHK